MTRDLVIANGRFTVGGNIERNLADTLDLVPQARCNAAGVVHYCESSPSGDAANNGPWISTGDTGRRESGFPGFTLRPDGRGAYRWRRNMPGAPITCIDPRRSVDDPCNRWRSRAIQGALHNADADGSR